jgi:hypothetical protein
VVTATNLSNNYCHVFGVQWHYNGVWNKWFDLLPLSLQLQRITIKYDSSQSVIAQDSLYSLTGLRVPSVPLWLTCFWFTNLSLLLLRLPWKMTALRMPSFCLSVCLMLRLTASQPVCLGIEHPSGAFDQICITVGQLWVCWCGALSLTKGRICGLQLLLTLASAVILRSESRGTHDHILLSQIQNFHFRCLLRLAGLRWRYATLPPHGKRVPYQVGLNESASPYKLVSLSL